MAATPLALLDRLNEAINRHDLEALVECFAPDYRSEQPLHPDRAFVGREQVHKNWFGVFENVPDIQAEVIRANSDDEMVWAELRWSGTGLTGEQVDVRGVVIMGVEDDHVVWGRLYMEPVQGEGRGIDAAVREMTQPSQEASST
jgi:ketosteroid isomerase-like protein